MAEPRNDWWIARSDGRAGPRLELDRSRRCALGRLGGAEQVDRGAEEVGQAIGESERRT